MDETTKPGNVTPISRVRKGKTGGTAEPEKDGKLKLAEIYKVLSDAIARQSWVTLPMFPERYGVIELELGARLPILISDDDSAQIVKPQALANSVLTYCDRQLAGRPEFTITARQAREVVEYYLAATTPVLGSDVKNARWQGEVGLTYRRLPWALAPGPAPTWETLLARMSNAQAFIDWTGSLFFEESSLQNYVWLYGIGGDGKGAINRFLRGVFDKAYRSKQPPGSGKFGDKFWAYGLLGARLVVFPDCDDYSFVARGLFKSLTGGDPVDVEAKGQMSFTTHLAAKYLIISNEKPSISSEKADMRRIIYCELGTCDKPDPDFEQKLWDEGGAFLSTCIEQYAEKYPTHGPILTDIEEIAGWVSTVEEPFEVVFESWFALDKEAWVDPLQMQDVLHAEWPRQRRAQLDFLRWLEKSHCVQKKSMRLGDNVRRKYVGIKLTKIPPDRAPVTGRYQPHLNNVDTNVDT